uniref:ABC1 atypical kinase-like domain-containing protein n=1 Tax=viral metagenome TaxID=1070528 RepID=A0A6C0JTP2_9ZZZZ
MFIIPTVLYAFWQYGWYCLGRSRLDCMRNMTKYLYHKNIVFSKLFQNMSIAINILSKEEIELLYSYNEHVPFTLNELYDIQIIMDDLNIHSGKDKIILTSPLPCKSGMISVVYYATMGEQDIVIKVKRPNITIQLLEGLNEFKRLIQWIQYLPYLYEFDLLTIYHENTTDMINQVDFKNEINNLISIQHNFKNIKYVVIPTVYPIFTSLNDNIIVMERLIGNKLQDISINTRLYEQYILLLFKLTIKSLLYDGCYHGDLHTGNIIFLSEEEPKIGLIDFGIIGRITRESQNNFYNFMKASLLDKDFDKASYIVTTHMLHPPSNYNELSLLTKQTILKDIINILKNTELTGTFDIQFMYNLNHVLYKHKLSLDRDFCKIQLSMLISFSVTDVLCKKCDNTFIHYFSQALVEFFNDELNLE